MSCGTSPSGETNKTNQPDIMVVEKKQKSSLVIEMEAPDDISKKEYKKLEEYQKLKKCEK